MLAAILLGVGAARASAGDEVAAQALELVHLGARVVEWPELTDEARDRARGRLDDAGFALLERAIVAGFAPARLAAAAGDAFVRDVSPGADEAFVAWFRAPLGARIAARDRSELDASLLREEPFTMSDATLEGTRDRSWQLARRLDEATGTSRDVLAVAGAVALAYARGAHDLACGDVFAHGAVERRTRRQLATLAAHVKPRVAASLRLGYGDLSELDLGDFVRFAGSARGRAVYDGVGAALGAALARAGARVQTQLAPEVARRCGS